MKWMMWTLAVGVACVTGCAWLKPPKEGGAAVSRRDREATPPAMMGTGSEPGYRPDDVVPNQTNKTK